MEAYEILEKEFANYIGTKYAVAVNTGMAALHLSLVALGIGKGDQVIVPEFTFAGCAFTVSYTGAKPVFVDCGNDLNIDCNLIEKKITPKTKAIMAVHIYGRPCEMDKIIALAKKYNLYIIEDCAEAHGAFIEDKKVGSFGDLGCFSFYKNKIVHAEEGGIITTNNKDLYEEIKRLKNMYFSDEHNFYHEKIGFNYRMANNQAMLALKSLKGIDKEINRRLCKAEKLNKIYGYYSVDRKIGSVYWVYDIMINNRDYVMKEHENTRYFFKPMSSLPMYLGRNYKSLNAYKFSEKGMYFQL